VEKIVAVLLAVLVGLLAEKARPRNDLWRLGLVRAGIGAAVTIALYLATLGVLAAKRQDLLELTLCAVLGGFSVALLGGRKEKN